MSATIEAPAAVGPIAFPSVGLIRLRQILGDKLAGIPAIIPVSTSTWYAGVKSGRYPQPVKLGPSSVAWRAEDIRKLIDEGVAA